MGAVRIAPMAKAFSVASWNIEHMKDGDPRNVARMKFLAGFRVLSRDKIVGRSNAEAVAWNWPRALSRPTIR